MSSTQFPIITGNDFPFVLHYFAAGNGR